MSAGEGFHETSSEPHAFQKDPWGHEHGEGDRGQSAPLHQPHRPETGAHLLGEPTKVDPGHRRALIAVLTTVVILAAVVAAVLVIDWV